MSLLASGDVATLPVVVMLFIAPDSEARLRSGGCDDDTLCWLSGVQGSVFVERL